MVRSSPRNRCPSGAGILFSQHLQLGRSSAAATGCCKYCAQTSARSHFWLVCQATRSSACGAVFSKRRRRGSFLHSACSPLPAESATHCIQREAPCGHPVRRALLVCLTLPASRPRLLVSSVGCVVSELSWIFKAIMMCITDVLHLAANPRFRSSRNISGDVTSHDSSQYKVHPRSPKMTQ